MLAFNLRVFFQNLQGEELLFFAKNEHCEVRFIGGVDKLKKYTDLNRPLAVTLTQGNLLFRISFEEVEEKKMANTEVGVSLSRQGEEELLLMQTSFLFDQITLKPTSGADEEPDDGPLTA